MKRQTLVILIFAAFIAGLFAGSWLDDWLDVDSCLDAGGAWNYERGLCDLA